MSSPLTSKLSNPLYRSFIVSILTKSQEGRDSNSKKVYLVTKSLKRRLHEEFLLLLHTYTCRGPRPVSRTSSGLLCFKETLKDKIYFVFYLLRRQKYTCTSTSWKISTCVTFEKLEINSS